MQTADDNSDRRADALSVGLDEVRTAVEGVTGIPDAFRERAAETGWLIEKWNSKTGEFGAAWWRPQDRYSEGIGYWSNDSTKALRFARERDAWCYITEAGWTDAKPTEHSWSIS